MLKLYKENPEFYEFSKFNTETGQLKPISKDEFNQYLPKDSFFDDKKMSKIARNGITIFSGETPKTHTRFPRRLYFQITRNCNLECPACFIRADKYGAHVPAVIIMDIARFMGDNGLMEVRLTGGEPTTHPDFFKILHKFQDENIYVSVSTNGLFGKKVLKTLSEEQNLWIICSIDGNRDVHNLYRSNTFDKIINNLRFLKNKNPDIRLRITTVLTKKNKNQIFEMGQICKYLDAESITIIPLRPQVRSPDIINDMVDAEEFKQVMDRLVEAQEKLGIKFTTTIETDYKEKIYKDPVFVKRSSCAAGREGVNLDYDAYKNEFIMYGCSYSPASDLFEDPKIRAPFLAGSFSPDNISSFLNIWRDDNAWTLFRDLTLKPDSCKSCEFLLKHQCTGSCPIQNIDYASLNVEKNVLDQLKEHLRRTSEWYCYKNIEKSKDHPA